MAKSKLLFETNDWTPEIIDRTYDAIAEIALKELKLDVYRNQIEIIGSDQMLDAYSSIGLPLMYNHWSFGKHFIIDSQQYRAGQKGLAYEIVINSDPCISYLMEENSMTMQALVIAHAAFGHNHFFKNNYLFRQWTDASSIVDYTVFAKKYIADCEEKYGEAEVELLLDCCHAIQHHGVDKYKRSRVLNKHEEKERQNARAEYVQQQANELWKVIPKSKEKETPVPSIEDDRFPKEPQENLLYFIEKYSPKLKSWEREVIRIVRKLGQYFYPQMQTQLMNEGCASFVHYYCMNRLYDKELISDGNMLEFLHSHTAVLNQLPWDHKYYNGINPYALGFDMYMDIKRICEHPTEEDREYFPSIAGENWVEVIHDAIQNYRDESFIVQFLSPRIVSKWRLFEISDENRKEFITITGIQNKESFYRVKDTLSKQYSLSNKIPDIQIVNANLTTDRKLEMVYTPRKGAELDSNKIKVLDYMKHLWGYEVTILEKQPEIVI